ncbi:hypothetical protein AFK69_00005, partial [Xenorhabdus sp. GDc328]|uniref:CHC2 zinc finger domain-containing protein n=1 Tax=Xenorhabdus sp. GDc328 TaxID=742178 RepID=UPI0006C54340
FHCFGCEAGGSVLDWVMQTEGLSLRHAAERLKAVLGHNPAVDPLGLAGGVNPYSYVHNPTGWVDPLGLNSKKCQYVYRELSID